MNTDELFALVRKGNLALLDDQITPDNLKSTSSNGQNLLHEAISFSKIDIATYLIENNIDINFGCNKKQTALHYSVIYKNLEKDIRFTQDTVSPNFSDGGTISDTVGDLRSGKLSPDDFPPVRVVEMDGKIYSLDNRRIATFSAAEVEEIPVQRLSLDDPDVRTEFLKKFRPIEDGKKVVVVTKAERAAARRILKQFGKYD